jgi:hypothetical protein
VFVVSSPNTLEGEPLANLQSIVIEYRGSERVDLMILLRKCEILPGEAWGSAFRQPAGT